MIHEAGPEADAGATPAPRFSIVSGNPTAAELAAVTAVLSAAVEEANTAGKQTKVRGQSAWQLAQRPIRMPLDRGVGTWRSFSG